MFNKSTNKNIPINLRKEFKTHHLTLITMGGSIGTGLFLASGATLAQAGPGGALLTYIIIGLMVYFLMTSLGEMAAYSPISGSFMVYGSKYVDEGFGFALGWNYWYNWAITIAVDLVAVQLIMKFWFPNIEGWIWSAIFLFIIFNLNYISIKGFSKAECWFSIIKVITVVFFIFIGVILIIIGIMSGAKHIGFYNWQIGAAPFVGGVSSMIKIAMIVGFSFQGTELIGITVGESKNPVKNIHKVLSQVFWKILFFYVCSILVISLIIPYNDPRLLHNNIDNISLSPFTLVFNKIGLLSATSIMNIVILIAILSTGNSGMYASTRILFALSKAGKAPKIFSYLSDNGVPRYALFVTTCISAICFLSSLFGNQRVYLWLLNTSGMTGFIVWLGIIISHYRFRRGYIIQGYDLKKLPYCSSFFPLGPILTFILCIIIIIGHFYYELFIDKNNLYNILATYISIPLFFIIWFGYKFIKKTSFLKYKNMDFNSSEFIKK